MQSIQRAREKVADLHVVVWSTVDDPRAVNAAFAAGADGYVLKTARPDDLTVAIRQVFERSIYLAKEGSLPDQARQAASESSAVKLTPREREILQLVAEGHSNAQLASMLWVSHETVKFHLSNIYEKLEVTKPHRSDSVGPCPWCGCDVAAGRWLSCLAGRAPRVLPVLRSSLQRTLRVTCAPQKGSIVTERFPPFRGENRSAPYDRLRLCRHGRRWTKHVSSSRITTAASPMSCDSP